MLAPKAIWTLLDPRCKRFLVVLAASLTLAACSSVRPPRNETLNTRLRPVSPSALVSVAKKQIGTPYRYGGEDPRVGTSSPPKESAVETPRFSGGRKQRCLR